MILGFETSLYKNVRSLECGLIPGRKRWALPILNTLTNCPYELLRNRLQTRHALLLKTAIFVSYLSIILHCAFIQGRHKSIILLIKNV